MSIRTTVTLDDDVVERVRRESRSRGVSFRETLNHLLRSALLSTDAPPRRLEIRSVHMGFRSGLNHDSVEALLEYAEGADHR